MNYTQMSEIERYQIRAYLKVCYSAQAIANKLNRAPSTISRALKRNTGLRGYRPQQAQRLADKRKQRHGHTMISDGTWRPVVSLLKENWSPEQTSGWLEKSAHPTVSTEWIYHYILIDKKTYDNGKEFAFHETIAQVLEASSYFAHPYHSWERGLNENTNGLIRQDAPKGARFDEIKPAAVINIMEKLNNRSRKYLDFKTPNQVLFGINSTISLAS